MLLPENMLGLNVPLLVQGWRQSSMQLSALWWCLWELTWGKMDGWQRICSGVGHLPTPSLLAASTFNIRTGDQVPEVML